MPRGNPLAHPTLAQVRAGSPAAWPSRRRAATRAGVLVAALALGACTLDNPTEPLPALSFEYFACAVQPVLDQDCATAACHGNADRQLRVLSPSRMRIASEYALARQLISPEEVDEGIHPALTSIELSFNYEQCRGFAASRAPGEPSLLLSKPLAVSAGGRYHAPAGDVFVSEDDPGYRAIVRWLAGGTVEECP